MLSTGRGGAAHGGSANSAAWNGTAGVCIHAGTGTTRVDGKSSTVHHGAASVRAKTSGVPKQSSTFARMDVWNGRECRRARAREGVHISRNSSVVCDVQTR